MGNQPWKELYRNYGHYQAAKGTGKKMWTLTFKGINSIALISENQFKEVSTNYILDITSLKNLPLRLAKRRVRKLRVITFEMQYHILFEPEDNFQGSDLGTEAKEVYSHNALFSE